MAVETATAAKLVTASFVCGIFVGFQLSRGLRGKLRDLLKRLNNNL
jgi:hypothetical protein